MYLQKSQQEWLRREGYLAHALPLLPKGEVFRGFIVYTGENSVPFRLVLDFIGTKKRLASLRKAILKASTEFARMGITYEMIAEISGKGKEMDEYIHLLNERYVFGKEKLLLAA
jgi:hypothetical protein